MSDEVFVYHYSTQDLKQLSSNVRSRTNGQEGLEKIMRPRPQLKRSKLILNLRWILLHLVALLNFYLVIP